MINYDQRLTALLRERQSVINDRGLEIILRPVPDKDGGLDPRAAGIMKKMMAAQSGAPREDPTIEQARNSMGFPNTNLNRREIYTRYIEVAAEDRAVPVWAYWPRRPVGKTDRAAFIYIHGGGWSGGSAFAVENPCRLLAEKADCVVFNVDYSLAPEHPYPAAFEDCCAVLRHVYENAALYGVDKSKIAIGGDSAGGNLSAAVAQRDRDEGGGMLKLQALIYPAIDLTPEAGDYGGGFQADIPQADRELIAPMLGLGGDDPQTRENYLLPGQRADCPYVSPAYGDKRGLCAALVITAEYDGLRPHGEGYARELQNAGVAVRCLRYCGVTHAFIDMLGFLPQTEDAVLEIAEAVKGL